MREAEKGVGVVGSHHPILLLLILVVLGGVGEVVGLVNASGSVPRRTAAAPDRRKQQQQQQQQQQRVPLSLEGPYNCVLTHATADFDTLAGAVALAKIWGQEDPDDIPCYCVMTTAHPSVSAFLTLHIELFPIRALQTLDPSMCRKVGVCDASQRDRLGNAVNLIDAAQEGVYVYDHHTTNLKSSDLRPGRTKFSMSNVGSVTTVLVEMLRSKEVEINEAEATLFALGIHSDTGSLTFDGSTERDAEALRWLMGQGCNQAVLTEFLPEHAPLSSEQLRHLQTGIEQAQTQRNVLKGGLVTSTVLVEARGFTPGMSRVAQMLLECTGVDVLLLGVMYANKPNRPTSHLNIIGRARVGHAASLGMGALDLGKLLGLVGGGGHAGAASATLKLSEAHKLIDYGDYEEGEKEERDTFSMRFQHFQKTNSIGGTTTASPRENALQVLSYLWERMERDQLKLSSHQETVAEDFMTSRVLTCPSSATVEEAVSILQKANFFAVPVVREQDSVLVGLVSRTELTRLFREAKDGGGDSIARVLKRPIVGVMSKYRGSGSTSNASAAAAKSRSPPQEGSFFSVSPCTPLRVIRSRMASEGGSGRAIVVDSLERVRGIITRTDLLRQFHYYKREPHRFVDAYLEWRECGVDGGRGSADDGDDILGDLGWMGGYV